MVDLVLLRHGRTDWNAARRIQGQADSQLDDLGHAQAEAVAPVLAALAPTAVWSSDSDRARSTASYVASALGLTPTFDARLREYSLGHREGLHHHEFEADAPAEYAEFVRANWDAVPGAEKHAEVADPDDRRAVRDRGRRARRTASPWSSRTAPRSAPLWPPCSAGRRRTR